MCFEQILNYFKDLINIPNWICPSTYSHNFQSISNAIGEPNVSRKDLKNYLVLAICKKLELHKNQTKYFIDCCANLKVYFNYQEKRIIRDSFDKQEIASLADLLQKKGINRPLKDIFDYQFYTQKEIIDLFIHKLATDQRRDALIESVFSAFLYLLFPEERLHIYNSHCQTYDPSFYSYLKNTFPDKYARNHALSILKLDNDLFKTYDKYEDCLSDVLAFIQNEYNKLNNYCYLCIEIDGIEQSTMWSFYANIVLFAEKFLEEELKIGYFHPDQIEHQTAEYIPNLNPESTNFKIANSGFYYKDCFIITTDEIKTTAKEIYSPYKILLLLQKNHRDEDTIPCPACRSFNVRGNSYPILGVKSWECHNPICPDKSKYNRGKRYSLSSIIKQEAIEDEKNRITKKSIREWALDVVSPKSFEEILHYLLKQYSFYNDIVYLYNYKPKINRLSGRVIINEPFKHALDQTILKFFNSSYFKKYLIKDDSRYQSVTNISTIDKLQIYNGNCRDVLKQLPKSAIDGAITSPPYYNAKEYSQWPNIYCYLYDMYNQTIELFNCLKPGSYYLYNIFDYFDNENNIVFSAMGKKRMILGAYIIDLFKRIGFSLQQNIIWYKGNIQGHRNTNQSNDSPYYQAPLNCYEHIFVFRKPGNDLPAITFPSILKASPVIKIIRGVNTLGHSAPYPLDIPDLLTTRLTTGTVIDPYSGSFTSARSALKHNLHAIAIERSKEYCELGINLIKADKQLI